MEIYKSDMHTHTHTHTHVDLQTHRHTHSNTNSQTLKFENTQTHTHAQRCKREKREKSCLCEICRDFWTISFTECLQIAICPLPLKEDDDKWQNQGT